MLFIKLAKRPAPIHVAIHPICFRWTGRDANGTLSLYEDVQGLMELFDSYEVGKVLVTAEILNGQKGVVLQDEGDTVLCKLGGQPVVTVEVKLESEGTPGGNAKVA